MQRTAFRYLIIGAVLCGWLCEAAGQAPAPAAEPLDTVQAEQEAVPAPAQRPADSSRTALLSPEENLWTPHLDDGTRWLIKSDIKKPRLYAIAGTFVAGDVIGVIQLTKNWYSTSTTRFHFHEFDRDWRQHEQMDKLGHLFVTHLLSHTTSQAFRWSGVSAVKSIWLGALTGYVAQLQIEMADGFFANWGFSYLDLAANTVGAGYAVLRQRHPETFGGVRLKISYQPSPARKQGLYPAYSDSILDDYDGMTFWVAANVHDVLPAAWQAGYPKWLAPFGVAVGHGVQDSGQRVFHGTRELYIGLDFDITKLPTGDSRVLKITKDILNFIRLPLPAIRIAPDVEYYGLYF